MQTNSAPEDKVDLLPNNGALFIAIGALSRLIVSKELIHNTSGKSEPREAVEYEIWQYRSDEQSSSMKAIAVDADLFDRTNVSQIIFVWHNLAKSSSSTVFLSNLALLCNIAHIAGNRLVLPNSDRLLLKGA